ncbi:Uncharacterised protein [Burkholderia pseudomallei]|nr:Uncharacterised protein [Burkholderia pseudomallei]CFL52295.1 Uncharacterised protein [Burkholderia pseudomallei]
MAAQLLEDRRERVRLLRDARADRRRVLRAAVACLVARDRPDADEAVVVVRGRRLHALRVREREDLARDVVHADHRRHADELLQLRVGLRLAGRLVRGVELRVEALRGADRGRAHVDAGRAVVHRHDVHRVERHVVRERRVQHVQAVLHEARGHRRRRERHVQRLAFGRVVGLQLRDRLEVARDGGRILLRRAFDVEIDVREAVRVDHGLICALQRGDARARLHQRLAGRAAERYRHVAALRAIGGDRRRDLVEQIARRAVADRLHAAP